jgi:hypothetical protein
LLDGLIDDLIDLLVGHASSLYLGHDGQTGPRCVEPNRALGLRLQFRHSLASGL